jgi:hypothetical protein
MKEPIKKEEIEGGVREEGVKEKKKFIYDKHGEIELTPMYANFVYGRDATCVDREHKIYLKSGKVLKRRFNKESHEVFLSFELTDVRQAGGRRGELVRIKHYYG